MCALYPNLMAQINVIVFDCILITNFDVLIIIYS